jgi:hypothetical protein
MSIYDCSKDLVHDLTIENNELREEIKRLRSELTEEKRLRLIAQVDRRYMANKLESCGCVHCIPHYMGDGEIECGDTQCCVALSEDYHFCPGCGAWIDWANAVDKSVTRPLSAVV